MTTLVWNYLPEYDTERDDIVVAIETVFRSGWLTLGDNERGFEDIGVRVFVDIDLDA